MVSPAPLLLLIGSPLASLRHPEVAAKRPSKGDGPGRSSFEARLRRAPQDDGRESVHHVPIGFAKSSRKYLNTLASGLGAAWPRPQIEASRMASASSFSNASSHGPFSISLTAFSVPTRHGVHWPQLSSSKKRIRLSATAFISSLSHRITNACDPTKQPYCSKVPKSSGRSAIAAGRIPPEAPPGR